MQFDRTCFVDSLRLYQSGVVLADNTATPSAAAPVISQSASSPVHTQLPLRPAVHFLITVRESCYTKTPQLELQRTKLPRQHPPTPSASVPLSCSHQVKSLTQRLAN